MSKADPIKSLKLTCPFCGQDESPIQLNLNDLSEITCDGCSEGYSVRQALEKANEVAARWQQLAAWIDAAPIVLH
jgi:transcription elongation factor Elf1